MLQIKSTLINHDAGFVPFHPAEDQTKKHEATTPPLRYGGGQCSILL